MIAAWDRSALLWMNRGLADWPDFERFVVMATFNDLLKGAAAMALAIAAWQLRPKAEQRAKLLSGLVGLTVALGLNRLLANALPFRPRPANDPSFGWHRSPFAPEGAFEELSSFPSDHAVLFGALALSVWSVHRRLGVVAWVHTLVVVLAPRLYLGLHYPSDLLAGMLLGGACVAVCLRNPLATALGGRLLRCQQRFPGWSAAALWLWIFSLATLFDDAIRLVQ